MLAHILQALAKLPYPLISPVIFVLVLVLVLILALFHINIILFYFYKSSIKRETRFPHYIAGSPYPSNQSRLSSEISNKDDVK
jgi:hypothetical protein